MNVRLYRLTLKALLFCVISHVAALALTAALLMPALDMSVDAQLRAEAVAQGPWRWRLGWIAWELAALGNVLMSAALASLLARTPHRQGFAWAATGLVLALLGVVPDMAGNLSMIFDLVEAAREIPPDPATYVAIESLAFWRVGTLAAGLYTAMGLCWLFAALNACGGSWRHRVLLTLGTLSAALFTFSAVANGRATMAAVEVGHYEGFEVGSLANALAFPLWLLTALWIGVALAQTHHAAHPAADAHARLVRWPHASASERLMARAANAHGLRDLARALTGRLALPQLRSDVTDVVFLNWLVPSERVAHLLPPPLKLHDLDAMTALTVLTYRHNHFGPLLLGPLRRLAPSPLQSNWRLYLAPERPDAEQDAVYFLSNCVDMGIMVPAARIFSDALPAHYASAFTHTRQGDVWITAIDPEGGSALDLRSEVIAVGEPSLPATFAQRFESWTDAVRYLTSQSRVLAVHTAFDALHQSNIHIPIDPEAVTPARVVGRIESRWLADLVRGCEPLVFVVPTLQFTAVSEGWIDGPTTEALP